MKTIKTVKTIKAFERMFSSSPTESGTIHQVPTEAERFIKFRRRRNDSSFHPGFTLIEIIVYISVFAALSAVAANTVLAVHSSLAEIRAVRKLNATASVAMERMTRAIRDASSVNVPASALDVSPGTLSLTGSESPALTRRFIVSGGSLILDDGAGGGVATLTPPGVAVANLVFRRIAASAVSEAVKIELTLAASSGRATTTDNFYSTAVLRNSYAQ